MADDISEGVTSKASRASSIKASIDNPNATWGRRPSDQVIKGPLPTKLVGGEVMEAGAAAQPGTKKETQEGNAGSSAWNEGKKLADSILPPKPGTVSTTASVPEKAAAD